MHQPEIVLRRARRTDFDAVAALLGIAGEAEPGRQELRRFRRVVADLGSDFYVAVQDSVVVGFVHVTYARQVFAPPRARVERLESAAGERRDGIRQALTRLAQERAMRRGCSAIDLTAASGDLLPG